MSNVLEEQEKMNPQETLIVNSSFKMDKKINKIDESGANNNFKNVLNKNNTSDLSDLSDILKYDVTSMTNESYAGADEFSCVATCGEITGFIDSNNDDSSGNCGVSSRKQLRFPDDYDDYEDYDSINDFGTNDVHKTLSMTNRYNPDETSTDTLHQQRLSICNISIHSQAMGGSFGVDIPSTTSESGTKGSKAFTNNTTSISSSTISSSDPNNRQQCLLSAPGTSGRNDYNFLVKSISQIENFSATANNNFNKRTESMNHSVSQPDNLSTHFMKDNNNSNNNTTVSSLHSTMEAILNVHRTQQYYTTNSDLEPFNNNQKSILTIHPQYRLLVSDTNSPTIIESTMYGNNGHPEQLITQQLNANNNEYPILSRHSSTESCIQSKLSAMQLNESTVMGTLSSNVSQELHQMNNDEKVNGKEAILKNVEKTSDHDLIRALINKKYGISQFGLNNTDSNMSIEEKLMTSIDSLDENEQYNKRTMKSLSDILGPFFKKLDRLTDLEELYSNEDIETWNKIKSKDNKRRVSFADQEFSNVKYCSKYDEDSTNDEFEIETTSNDNSTTECDDRSETESNIQSSIKEKKNHGLSSTELRLKSTRNLQCGTLGPPVLNLRELSVLYSKQDTSTPMENKNISTDDEDENLSITLKSPTGTTPNETRDVTTSYSTSTTPTPRSQIDSIENQITYAIPPFSVDLADRWTCLHGLPPMLKCLDTTEFILIDLDNDAIKRGKYKNEKVYTFRNDKGDVLFYGIEHPQFCTANTCDPYRPFEMIIYDIHGRQLIKLSRFTSCIAGCLIPCFYHTLTVHCPGQIHFGMIKQDITLCIPSYTVYNNIGRDCYMLRGPFGAYFSGSNLTFSVYDKTPDGYVNCGLITDHWEHEQQYMFKNNIYGVKFPLNFGPKCKILLLSAAVLLKNIYFSGSFHRRQVNNDEHNIRSTTTPVLPISTTSKTHPVITKQPELSSKTTASIVSYETTSSVREIVEQCKPSSTMASTNLPSHRVRKIGKQFNNFIDDCHSMPSTTKTEPNRKGKIVHRSSNEKSIQKVYSKEIEL